jgi:phosphosulfolactate synthase
MGFDIQGLPARTSKPRTLGLTMILDKGLSTTQAANVAELGASAVDIVKFGWGTALVSPNLTEKIAIYKAAGIDCYLGGTLFEWFLVRNNVDGYLKLVDSLGLEKVEISNGTIWIEEPQKCELIHRVSRHYQVFSEVGSKNPEQVLSPETWVSMISAELEAGASKIICEARESGNVGVFGSDGKVKTTLIDHIVSAVSADKLMFEAPNKDQQVWFVKKFGANVNLGNINPWDIIALETVRLGLRSDTFMHFLAPEYRNRYEEVTATEV